MKRRHFIGSLGTISGGFILSKAGYTFSPSIPLDEKLKASINDEDFWKIIRKEFLFPKDYIYLNTSGIGAVPKIVLDKVKTSMDELEIKPRPGHDHENWLSTKEKCATLLGPGCKKEEVALTNTATEGINIIINGLPLRKGDEIITSTHEHPALHVPLLNRMQQDGIVFRTFKPNLKNGPANIFKINHLINEKTRLIFISHVSCTVGQRNPIKEIGHLAKQKGIWFAVDGAQAMGAIPIDVMESNVDFYAFSGHKWLLGPKRTGGLYVRSELLDTLKPKTVGAYSDDGYNISNMTLKFHPSAQRYEYGTQNESLFLGLGAAIDFISNIGVNRVLKHNKDLAELFYNGLQEIPEVEILSPEEDKFRTSVITFKVKGKNYKNLASFLSNKMIRVRVVHEANLNGIRASFHLYNDNNNVKKIIKEVKNFIKS